MDNNPVIFGVIARVASCAVFMVLQVLENVVRQRGPAAFHFSVVLWQDLLEQRIAPYAEKRMILMSANSRPPSQPRVIMLYIHMCLYKSCSNFYEDVSQTNLDHEVKNWCNHTFCS
jgi:hypothetical protein